MHFEKFVNRKIKQHSTPTITITQRGIINLNAITMKKYVQNREHLIFYYNREENKIGLRFIEEPTSESYKIRRISLRSNTGQVSALAFLNYYKIDWKKTKAYYAEWNAQEEMLIIDLKKPVDEILKVRTVGIDDPF